MHTAIAVLHAGKATTALKTRDDTGKSLPSCVTDSVLTKTDEEKAKDQIFQFFTRREKKSHYLTWG